MKPKKYFGQNFLNDEVTVERLVAAAEVNSDDIVLEVGSGLGRVTTKLANRAKKVIAVEIDPDLIPILRNNLKTFSNVEIINADILHFLKHYHPTTKPQDHKILGSLPYQITSPLLHQLATYPNWEKAAFLVQKEVAQKIVALPPHATYLANFVQNYADVKLVAIVSRGAFRPVPKVDGAIIRLKKQQSKERVDPQKWSAFLHRGFAHPRQMLNKVLPMSGLTMAGIDPRRRPATLTLKEWSELYQRLNK